MEQKILLFNIDALLKMGRNDMLFVQKMLLLFVQMMPKSLDEMQQAIQEKEWLRLASLGHKIKSSVAGLGIVTIADDFKKLEFLCKAVQIEEQEIVLTFNSIKLVIDQSIHQMKHEYPEFFLSDTLT
jgi:HPt (histidine-containing phosphotransfer) domain-containing protein